MKTKISKLFILAILILTANFASAFSWDSAGNVFTGSEFIGSTNGGNYPVKFKIANTERFQINTDGIRFNGANPIFAILNNNGQITFLHNTTNGCTALFANISTIPKTLNLCDDGLTLTGGPINAKTKYTITSTPTYTVTALDHTIECMPGGIENLPTVTGTEGKRYEFVNPTNTVCTVLANGLQTIGNLNPEPKYKILPGGAVILVSNGNVWRIIGDKVGQ